jgi:hypothetical protein
MEYAPVCGEPVGPICDEDMNCPDYLLPPKTYSNKCVMNAK